MLERAAALNPEQIVLSGGEPMVRKDFMELLQYLRQRFKNKISFSTNGLLINEANIKYLNSCNCNRRGKTTRKGDMWNLTEGCCGLLVYQYGKNEPTYVKV